ncbi:hypothetical protein CRENBAI_005023 [Crenichthys baileyi]|uniref:Uncharacterized protein n=1 Tax=Crenichthys baileyi TaxID=28760 RepID=A0AAV9SNG6_9TELE
MIDSLLTSCFQQGVCSLGIASTQRVKLLWDVGCSAAACGGTTSKRAKRFSSTANKAPPSAD